MERFLERLILQKLTQEKVNNLNSSIKKNNSVKEIELVVKNLWTEKAPGPDDFTGEFYKEEIISVLHEPYQKWKSRNTSQLILWGKYKLDTETKQTFQVRRATINILHEQRYKNHYETKSSNI